MKSNSCWLLLFLICLFVFTGVSYAFDIRRPSDTEVFIGYGSDEKLKTGNYTYYLMGLDFTYPLKQEGWMRNLSFQIEPFFAFVTSPDTGIETGCSFFLKYKVPLNSPIKPYIRGGIGGIYMTQKTEEQGSQLNFVDQLCYGVAYEKNGKTFSLEFRNRHISNLDLKEPNSGIDSKVWMLGYTSFF
ncbi:acyloxyacyl hydrolase [bacterium]|nr:acyloxyacyl hydrolase [bacterium]